MKRKPFLKGFLSIIAILVLIGIILKVYVSDYYHANRYDDTNTSDVIYADYEDFVIYGNTIAQTGFIFYPGGRVEASAYEPLLKEIANEGICCVLMKMPYNLAVLKPNAADSAISQITTVEHWYIGGHSLGGAMAAGYAATYKDNVDGIILLAAYPTKQIDKSIPVLSIYGTNDGVLDKEKYKKSISLAPNFNEVLIEGGNHAFFGNYGKQKNDGDATITKEEQWQQTKDNIVKFIEKNNQ